MRSGIRNIMGCTVPRSGNRFGTRVHRFSGFGFNFASGVSGDGRRTPLTRRFGPCPYFANGCSRVVAMGNRCGNNDECVNGAPRLRTSTGLAKIGRDAGGRMIRLLRGVVGTSGVGVLPRPGCGSITFSRSVDVSPGRRVRNFAVAEDRGRAACSVAIVGTSEAPIALAMAMTSIISCGVTPGGLRIVIAIVRAA